MYSGAWCIYSLNSGTGSQCSSSLQQAGSHSHAGAAGSHGRRQRAGQLGMGIAYCNERHYKLLITLGLTWYFGQVSFSNHYFGFITHYTVMSAPEASV